MKTSDHEDYPYLYTFCIEENGVRNHVISDHHYKTKEEAETFAKNKDPYFQADAKIETIVLYMPVIEYRQKWAHQTTFVDDNYKNKFLEENKKYRPEPKSLTELATEKVKDHRFAEAFFSKNILTEKVTEEQTKKLEKHLKEKHGIPDIDNSTKIKKK